MIDSKNIITVTKLNKYIREKLEDDFVLSSILITGEVSNFKYHSSGHMYFTLKDKNASINCVMFKSYANGVKFTLENGMKIIIGGYVSIYETTGQFQFYAEIMEPVGIGSLSLAFEQLKEKLNNKEYFDKNRKKIIPKYIKTVAIITSGTGAAVEDIIKTITRRNNSIKIVIIPTLVQGNDAKFEIVKSIDLVNRWGKSDAIILGRGGGSIEDLWAFNEEIVATAIFNSKIPIVCGIGHETDFTIADFVADISVSTPTAAAEIISYPKELIYNELFEYIFDLNALLHNKFNDYENRLTNLLKKDVFLNPEIFVTNLALKIKIAVEKINKAIDNNFNFNKNKFTTALYKIEVLSPLNTLKRGYCLVSNENNEIQIDINKIKIGDNVNIKMQNGNIQAEVKEMRNL